MATLADMVRGLEKVFPNGPSWPFRTESARTVWDHAERIYDRHPDWTASDVVRQAFADANVPASEFTRDDFSVLSMAARWKSYVLRNRRAEKQNGSTVLPAPPTPYPNRP